MSNDILLVRTRQVIAEMIHDNGGCDHSVGICACADLKLVKEIDDALMGEAIKGIIAKFASAHRGDVDERAKLARIAAGAIAHYANDEAFTYEVIEDSIEI